MIHQTGLHPPDPAKRIHRYSAADLDSIRAARKTLKGSADLRPFGYGVLDQGASSTCWAHSLVTALYRRRKVLGESPTLQSPLYFAQVVYAVYRAQAVPVGQPLPKLSDDGAQLDDADRCAAQWGSADFQAAQQGGGTDVPATVDGEGNPILGAIPELTVALADQGASKPFAGEYDIPPDGSAPETVAAALDVNTSTWIGGPVGSSLDDYQAGQIEQPVSEADAEGGHAREVVGYRLNSKGELEFLIENSWSDSWGDGGYSWASAGVISGAWSLLPFQVAA